MFIITLPLCRQLTLCVHETRQRAIQERKKCVVLVACNMLRLYEKLKQKRCMNNRAITKIAFVYSIVVNHIRTQHTHTLTGTHTDRRTDGVFCRSEINVFRMQHPR